MYKGVESELTLRVVHGDAIRPARFFVAPSGDEFPGEVCDWALVRGNIPSRALAPLSQKLEGYFRLLLGRPSPD